MTDCISNAGRDLIDFVQNNKFIIYGAHLVAAELSGFVSTGTDNRNFLGFAVTSAADNPKFIKGHPVRCFDEYELEKDTAVL
ncbi:MAG: hypothetical protein J1F64_08325, partial [Oscillospiraceae bacterium]|nr:hypothetical protein [Oscillospiraceae bacterium]